MSIPPARPLQHISKAIARELVKHHANKVTEADAASRPLLSASIKSSDSSETLDIVEARKKSDTPVALSNWMSMNTIPSLTTQSSTTKIVSEDSPLNEQEQSPVTIELQPMSVIPSLWTAEEDSKTVAQQDTLEALSDPIILCPIAAKICYPRAIVIPNESSMLPLDRLIRDLQEKSRSLGYPVAEYVTLSLQTIYFSWSVYRFWTWIAMMI
jgi:hypothetical protein